MRSSTKIRCSRRGTKAICLTSILSFLIISGCGHDRIDTEPNAPNTKKEISVCTTRATNTTTTIVNATSTSTVEKSSTTSTATSTPQTTTTAVTTSKTTPILSTTTNYINTTTTTTQGDIITTTTLVPEVTETYVVYKPSTYYVHKNTCRWNCGDAYRITDTEGIKARKCSECNPDIKIVCEYAPSVNNAGLPITETERILLCNLVGREYGSDWVPVPEKAKVVAVAMNRVRDPRFPNNIYDVLTQPYQFSGYVPCYSYTYQVTDSVIEAVNYYFAHPDEFGNWLYFEGDNTWNYFS